MYHYQLRYIKGPSSNELRTMVSTSICESVSSIQMLMSCLKVRVM